MLAIILLCFQAFFLTNCTNITPRIIGGREAAAGQFPFSAAIYQVTNDGTYFCGGTLLNQEWIVTAGQCVDGAILFDIRLGITNLKSTDGLKLATDYYVLHPDYNPFTLQADIGLIKLRLPITFTDYIQPVDFLPVSDLQAYSGGIGLGWGQTTDNAPGLVDDLNWVYLTVLSNDECKLIYGDQIQDDMVCAEGNYNEGTCQGDSGGPLIEVMRMYTTLVGIASFISFNGCESTDPSGYTRVYPYSAWIQNVTGL